MATNRTTLVATAVAVLLVVALACDRPKPVKQLEYRVAGLEKPAEILVDRWGVPHLYAESSGDVFFLQGFNAARDRLWQLDLWKRRGEGTLAEVFGEDFVEQDRAARLFLYRGDMYSEWLAYASDTKRIVGAFVQGINAYVELTRRQPELLPIEFELLDYQPSDWTPETVVRIRSHGLLRNVRSEVARSLLLAEHGKESLKLRDHYEPAHQLEVPEGLDLETIPSEVLDSYDLGTRSVRFPVDLLSQEVVRVAGGGAAIPQTSALASTARWPALWPDLWAEGSNNWAVSPRLTSTGRAILADDPHRALSVPSLRYIAHLSAPGLNVIGAGEPALPGVSIGHNGEIAFGLTIFGIDQEDLFTYDLHPDDPRLYKYQERWEPVSVVRETIGVRDRQPVAVELEFTRHGPVLHRDHQARRAFALQAAWLKPGMAPYLGSIEYMRARNWDEFLAAMNRWGAPSENQVFADSSGNIGWKPGGRTPIRQGWDGLLPVPGDGRYEWAGYRDMDELPVEYNPERGWVASANQMNLPAGFENPTGYEWASGYRYQRIAETLGEVESFSIDDAVLLQTDYLSIPARRLQRVLEIAGSVESRESERAARARALLTDWDARLQPESAPAALFEVWWRRFLAQAVVSALIDDPDARRELGRGNSRVILDLLERPDSRWGTRAVATRDETLVSSLVAAAEHTEELLGADWSSWRWGDLHHAALAHPLSALVDEDLRGQLNVQRLPRGGSGNTPGNTSYDGRSFRQVSGATFRMVVDVGEWDNSVAMNSPGQSGDSRSRHYRDLFPLWATDQSFPLLYSRDRIEEETLLIVKLRPR